MKSLTIAGTVDRRILVSYRVDPEVAARHLPAPFRPALYGAIAMAGVCLIRLTHLRPGRTPQALGMTTENIAHRFAVESDGPDGVETSVYVPRRDTSSRLSQLLGGRLFPGPMAHGRFHVDESDDRLHVRYHSDDGVVSVEVRARQAERIPASSLFDSLHEASEFYRRDSVGHSPSRNGDACEAMEFLPKTWDAQPLEIESLHSNWFDDESRFPRGSIELDSALLMRAVDATWIAGTQTRARALR
jgi:hypothetical protein